jgi:hypothetical protein
VPQAHGEKRKEALLICGKATEKMAEGPAEAGCRKQASNHLKRLRLRAVVVSVEEKSEINPAGMEQRNE